MYKRKLVEEFMLPLSMWNEIMIAIWYITNTLAICLPTELLKKQEIFLSCSKI